MDIHAAILWEQTQPLSVEAAVLDPPGPGEVLVEVRAAGVCHSDLHPARGDWPAKTPLVLGHEGAGIVRDIGPSVTRVSTGDHVVLCWAPACGECAPCREGRAVLCDRLEKTTYRNRLPSGASRLHARQQDVAPFLGTACFSTFVVVPQEAAIVVGRDLPFDALATLGCAVLTGVGAVLNAAKVPAGAQVAVIGAGGVGLNVVQGAAIAGAERIIAIDLRPAPLAIAKQFGATDTIDAAADVPPAVRALTNGRGADFVFDTVGSPATLATAIAAARKGGAVVLTGLSRVDSQGSIPMFAFVMQEKRLIGSVYGSGNPARDIPQLVALYQDGRLKLRELVSRTYSLDQINTALDALAASDGARGVVRW
jgi:S-(hydroxymethyl)glutathione dehydrogenase / alcohol dehydrogenase